MLIDAAENILRSDELTRGIQVDEHDAGVKVFMLRIEPHLIDLIRHFGKPRVRRGGKGLSTQVQLPQRAQGIDNEHIRVEVQHPFHLLRQDERG